MCRGDYRKCLPLGCKKGDARCAAGIIENVCLLGAPLGASAARWERAARVVHGRIINGYSKSDIILGLVFRAKSLSLSVAGIQKVRQTLSRTMCVCVCVLFHVFRVFVCVFCCGSDIAIMERVRVVC